MKKVTFKNTRFNPDITPFHDLAKKMAKAVGYTVDLDIDKQLAPARALILSGAVKAW